jgi:ectoine hydroxylase-related dioxygenase (phytanoyl-CoA dioxygenase family)
MKINFELYKKELDQNGFAIIDTVFTDDETDEITSFIETEKNNFTNENKSKDLFAIRKLFSVLPGIKNKIINNNIKSIINNIFGPNYFIVKGLYFDKPSLSNWFVSYHQDLSVCVSNKNSSSLYKGWTIKENRFGVQPPLEILESIYTIRIHLDDCTAQNGALYVIAGSHKKGINLQEAKTIKENESICEVKKGSVMLMRPLLLHASHKSTTLAKRRVLHLECCNKDLPESIHWAEKEFIS